MEAFGLNAHHDGLIRNYLRFTKFQREQCSKILQSSIKDVKDTKLTDNTYTIDEVQDLLDDLSLQVLDEVDNELINSAHTNVLLLQQVFKQAQKWHLNLDADLAELENRELLDKVKNWEESKGSLEDPSTSLVKGVTRLAPLHSSSEIQNNGPFQLLELQISNLENENKKLQERCNALEIEATTHIEDNIRVKKEMKELQSLKSNEKGPFSLENNNQLQEFSEKAQMAREELDNEKKLREAQEKELYDDLTHTKHSLLEIQSQLRLAEKELEGRFSETGAYKNLKKMLSHKNDQIKELRRLLNAHEEESRQSNSE